MQQPKTSNKKRKGAEETPVAGINATEQTAPKRVARNSKSKTDSAENKTAARHRTSAAADLQEVTETIEIVATSEIAGTDIAQASAAFGTSPLTPVAEVSVVEVLSPRNASLTSAVEDSSAPQITSEDIARLAHSFWLARGCQHGSAEEDWLRAEQQLRQTAAGASA